jgi:ribosome biogenesis protein Nip4
MRMNTLYTKLVVVEMVYLLSNSQVNLVAIDDTRPIGLGLGSRARHDGRIRQEAYCVLISFA